MSNICRIFAHRNQVNVTRKATGLLRKVIVSVQLRLPRENIDEFLEYCTPSWVTYKRKTSLMEVAITHTAENGTFYF